MLRSSRLDVLRPVVRCAGLAAAVAVTLGLVGAPQPASSAAPPPVCIVCNVSAVDSCSGQPLTASGCCRYSPVCLQAVDASSGCVGAVAVICH